MYKFYGCLLQCYAAENECGFSVYAIEGSRLSWSMKIYVNFTLENGLIQ